MTICPSLKSPTRRVMEQLLADPAVADAVVLRLAPAIAVIDPAKVDILIARLKKLGHLPGVVE